MRLKSLCQLEGAPKYRCLGNIVLVPTGPIWCIWPYWGGVFELAKYGQVGYPWGPPVKSYHQISILPDFPIVISMGVGGAGGPVLRETDIYWPLYDRRIQLEVQHLHHGVSNVTLVLKPALY